MKLTVSHIATMSRETDEKIQNQSQGGLRVAQNEGELIAGQKYREMS